MLYRLSYVGLFTLPDTLPSNPGMERVMGIEPTPSAWKAEVLPLNYTRSARRSRAGPVLPRCRPTCLSQSPTPLR